MAQCGGEFSSAKAWGAEEAEEEASGNRVELIEGSLVMFGG